jgi:hypothetical protein
MGVEVRVESASSRAAMALTREFQQELERRYEKRPEPNEPLDRPIILLQALDVAMRSLRLCLQRPRLKEAEHTFDVAECHRTAAYRKAHGTGQAVYLCEPCMRLYRNDDWNEFEPVPHAGAVRAFNALLYAEDEPTNEKAVRIARELLRALPRCPDPLRANGICPRCDYARDPLALLELERVLCRHYFHVEPSTLA